MDTTERTLLDNVLNALDRLFDGQTQVADVCDILFATSVALANTDHATRLKEVAYETDIVRSSSLSPERKRDHALAETDELRKYLSNILYNDSPLKI